MQNVEEICLLLLYCCIQYSVSVFNLHMNSVVIVSLRPIQQNREESKNRGVSNRFLFYYYCVH